LLKIPLVHPLKNILNGLRWQSELNPSDYSITYRHRGAPGDVKTVRASDIKSLGKSYFTLQSASGEEETVIPFHRVLEVRRSTDGSILWVKRKA